MPGKTTGDRIRQAITEAGYNPHSFSKHIGVSYSTVHRWVTNQRMPERESLIMIAKATGRSVPWLLDTEGKAVKEPQHEAWRAFLERYGDELDPWERHALASLDLQDRVPSEQTYHALLVALRGTVR